MTVPHYAPEHRLRLGGAPAPAALRAAVTSVRLESGLQGADRLELTLTDPALRWLDDPLLGLDASIGLSLGYAPNGLEEMFVGEVVALSPTLPSSGTPTLTVVAQDRMRHLQQGVATRWFAVSVPKVGQYPLPDLAVGSAVALENRLLPAFEPIGAALSVLLGGIDVAVSIGDPGEAQKAIRRQVGESDHDFLARISAQNGWEMTIDHSGPFGGSVLRFFSPADHLDPDVTLRWGRSLVEFTPRVSTVGEILAFSVRLWRPEIRTEFTVTVSWDWDRQSLAVSVVPSYGLPAAASAAAALGTVGRRLTERAALRARRSAERADLRLQQPRTSRSVTLLDEPVTLASAPRVLVGKLLPMLNTRLTGSGSTIGDPRIRAGSVLRLEGVGARFGGLYRVTSATHTLDGGGYRTSFEVRKEIWFGSVPLPAQGAVPVRLG